MQLLVLRSLALSFLQIKVNAIAPETTETIQVQPKKRLLRIMIILKDGIHMVVSGSHPMQLITLFLASDLSSWVTATINLDVEH